MVSKPSFQPGRIAETYRDATGREELSSEEIGFIVAVEQELMRVHAAMKALAEDLDKLRESINGQ